MPVSGISPTSDFLSEYTPPPDRVVKKTLDQEDFFKLLAVQFSSQDPLKPMEDTSFIAQMANFTALENSTQLSLAFTRFTEAQGFATAQNLLGRSVTLVDATDTEVTGVVSAVYQDSSGPRLTVNGNDYAVASVRRVEMPATPTTPAPAAGN